MFSKNRSHNLPVCRRFTNFAPFNSRHAFYTASPSTLNAGKQCRPLGRDGRVVDYTGLENRHTATYRGFESLSLRQAR